MRKGRTSEFRPRLGSPSGRQKKKSCGRGQANSTNIPQTSRWDGQGTERLEEERGGSRKGLSHRSSSLVVRRVSLTDTSEAGGQCNPLTPPPHCHHQGGLEILVQHLNCPLSPKPAWLGFLAWLMPPHLLGNLGLSSPLLHLLHTPSSLFPPSRPPAHPSSPLLSLRLKTESSHLQLLPFPGTAFLNHTPGGPQQQGICHPPFQPPCYPSHPGF